MPKHGINCPCVTCYHKFEAKGMSWDSDKRRYVKSRGSSGGTMKSTSFKSQPQRSDCATTNHYFNGPGDGSKHGHVKETRRPDGSVSYPYVRDVEGNEYGK